MSLVGAEVDVSIEADSLPLRFRPIVSDDEASVPENQHPVADLHPPLTPPRPVEKLFLDDLETQNISAAALAQVIHQSYKSSTNWTGTSVNTDDFATALPWTGSDEDNFQLISARSTDTLTPFADDDSESDSYDNIFQKDVLSRNYSIPETETTFKDSNMATTASTPYSTTTASSTPKKFFPSEAPKHVDAAEKIYDTAKGVWAWGKTVMVFKPFLGIAENVAGTVVGMTGNSLQSVDGHVVDHLHTIDDKLLNPAITQLVGALLGAAGKTEEVIGPIIAALLKNLGLIKNTAENPEVTSKVQ